MKDGSPLRLIVGSCILLAPGLFVWLAASRGAERPYETGLGVRDIILLAALVIALALGTWVERRRSQLSRLVPGDVVIRLRGRRLSVPVGAIFIITGFYALLGVVYWRFYT